MNDVKCPYCNHEQEINHDDGYGYDDGEFEQDCTNCNEPFEFITSISFNYEVYCKSEHDMEKSAVKGCEDMWSCNKCDFYELRKE